MRKVYWLDDEAWARIEPHLPRGRRGARRVDDHRVISGIVHMLQSGARWRDCPPEYGPYTTVYNRFNRWSRQGVWHDIFKALTGHSGIYSSASSSSRPSVCGSGILSTQPRRRCCFSKWRLCGKPVRATTAFGMKEFDRSRPLADATRFRFRAVRILAVRCQGQRWGYNRV
jgi:transposase